MRIGTLYLQLGWVAHNDAQAIRDDPDGVLKKAIPLWAWAVTPIPRPLTPDEQNEAARLDALAARFFYQAHAAGAVCDGTDYAFGDEA